MSQRFKVDENLPTEVCDLLKANACDAVYVLNQGLGGAADPTITDVCNREDRALFTGSEPRFSKTAAVG